MLLYMLLYIIKHPIVEKVISIREKMVRTSDNDFYV